MPGMELPGMMSCLAFDPFLLIASGSPPSSDQRSKFKFLIDLSNLSIIVGVVPGIAVILLLIVVNHMASPLGILHLTVKFKSHRYTPVVANLLSGFISTRNLIHNNFSGSRYALFSSLHLRL
jgi:hypothetical protein